MSNVPTRVHAESLHRAQQWEPWSQTEEKPLSMHCLDPDAFAFQPLTAAPEPTPEADLSADLSFSAHRWRFQYTAAAGNPVNFCERCSESSVTGELPLYGCPGPGYEVMSASEAEERGL